MSRLQELMAELCPDGVEYKALGDVGELIKGSGLQKKDFTETGIGCIHYGQIHTRFGTHTSQVLSYVPESMAKKLTVVHPGDVVVAVTSEDVSACCKAVAWVGNADVVTGGHCVVIRHGLEPKYLSYCFQTKDFFDQKKKFAAGVKVVEMRTDKLARIRIPVPPIEVQREVVRILDEYTTAHNELVMQLEEERDYQSRLYNCALDNYLRELKDVPMVNLGDICSVYDGTHVTPQYVDKGVRFISVENIEDLYGSEKYITEEAYQTYRMKSALGDVFMTRIGTIGRCAVVTKDEPLAYYVSVSLLKPDHRVVTGQYLKIVLESSIGKASLRKNTLLEAVPIKINLNRVGKVKIPLPSLNQQRYICEQFGSWTMSLHEYEKQSNLEIEHLAQQLALARNQLLSFPEKVA